VCGSEIVAPVPESNDAGLKSGMELIGHDVGKRTTAYANGAALMEEGAAVFEADVDSAGAEMVCGDDAADGVIG